VLQEKVFRRLGSNRDYKSDFRLITATNQAPEKLIGRKLREDFYHRIAHFVIEVPPLRERTEDIVDLADEFVQAIANRENLPIQGLTERARTKLCSYPWPGNVRELQAVIEGGVYLARFRGQQYVDAEDLRLSRKKPISDSPGVSFRDRIRSYEQKLIEETLARCGNNQVKAAKMLQMDRTTLRRILGRSDRGSIK